LTHISSSTRVLLQTKVVYQAKFFRVQTGRIPSWTYSKADVYRGTTVCVYIEKIGVVVMFEIREVIGLNLGRDISYPE
jgi:hypothetical protein